MQLAETVDQLAPLPRVGSRELDDVLQIIQVRDEIITRSIVEIKRILNREIGFGHFDTAPVTDNVKGVWARVTLDDPTDIGVAIPVAHNFGLPVISSGGANPVNLPNVRWWAAWMYGIRDGSVVAPAAPGANPGFTVFFKTGDAVTTNAIDLRFYSALVPAATTPIFVDLFFIPAVR